MPTYTVEVPLVGYALVTVVADRVPTTEDCVRVAAAAAAEVFRKVTLTSELKERVDFRLQATEYDDTDRGAKLLTVDL